VKLNQMILLAIVALTIVALVWYSSRTPSGAAAPVEAPGPTSGATVAAIGAGAASLIGGIVDAATPRGTVQQANPAATAVDA